ncbi:hypothetical protein PFAG_01373 [Plasmodium falciparum Santa Lucia]|nr:hypothetical protein PFAG_01373 [Plasmodium falciparum Santa Lucia]
MKSLIFNSSHSSNSGCSDDDTKDDEDTHKVKEYIDKIHLLNNNYNIKIKINEQNEKENFVHNSEYINMYIKKHELFKKKLNDIYNFLKKKSNYNTFEHIERVYKTVSNINSSYEFISLKIRIETIIEQIKKNLQINYHDTIIYLNEFLQIRYKIFKYNNNSIFLLSKKEINHHEDTQKNFPFLKNDDKFLENDIMDYINYKKSCLFQSSLNKKKENHSNAYVHLYEMDKDKINDLNG